MNFGLSILFAVFATIGILLSWLAYFKLLQPDSTDADNMHCFFKQRLDKKTFILSFTYPIGFALIRSIQNKNRMSDSLFTERQRKLEQVFTVLYGQADAKYYALCLPAAEASLSFIFVMFGCIAAVLFPATWPALCIWSIGAVLLGSLEYDIRNKYSQKKNAILNDYPEVLAKLALLTNAGMTVFEAWEKTALSSPKTIYVEMRYTIYEIKNNISYTEAFHHFSKRCGLSETDRLACLLSHNITRGGTELAKDLIHINNEAWAEKKRHIKQKAEKANTRMMTPLFIMFAGILGMIIIPIFADLVQSIS